MRLRTVEALFDVLDQQVPFDLLLLGIDAEDEALHAVAGARARDGDTPIIVASSSKSPEAIARMCRRGATDVVDRPLVDAELMERIALHLGDRWDPRAADVATEDSVWLDSELERTIKLAAESDVPVLLLGETGVGKGFYAKEMHRRSGRSGGPFVTVLCSTLPSSLMESELFGYERGAFTGAARSKPGRFELAQGGTIFLDEIAELAPHLQAKLLHVLHDGRLCRLGGSQERKLDVRVICATNQDLVRRVKDGRFREDLLYRINVITLTIPPLRERRQQIPKLFRQFARRWSHRLGRLPPAVDEELLRLYPFRGNVRELENIAKWSVLFQDRAALEKQLFIRVARGMERSLKEVLVSNELAAGRIGLLDAGRRAAEVVERGMIESALMATRGNRKQAARLLRLNYTTILQKIDAYRLSGF